MLNDRLSRTLWCHENAVYLFYPSISGLLTQKKIQLRQRLSDFTVEKQLHLVFGFNTARCDWNNSQRTEQTELSNDPAEMPRSKSVKCENITEKTAL